MALNLRKNFCFAEYLENKLQIFTRLYICIHIDKIWTGLLHVISFIHICTRVVALDLRKNFVSAKYLENKLTGFYQIIYICIHKDNI